MTQPSLTPLSFPKGKNSVAELLDSLSNFGFAKVGEIALDGAECPRFVLIENRAEHGWVYLWLEISNHSVDIVYVGKAGATLSARCRQHIGGFKGGSTSGSKHAGRIRAGVDSGKRYEIWARKSDVIRLFGESGISMSEVEERALIQKFRPTWNF